MYIGGSIDDNAWSNVDEWVNCVKDMGYNAVICPINCESDNALRKDFKDAIAKNDFVLGEVGVWRNTLDPDDAIRKKHLDYCKGQLDLADEMEASCCVNIVGARGKLWDGAYADNYSDDTYTLIVDSIRDVIDSVKPKNTFFTIEPMPWMVPDSPDSYLKLLKDVNRDRFAVHLDYTNMINNPYKYLHSSDFIRECFSKLGQYVKSVHVKDAVMEEHLPCVIKEVIPGKGTIDLRLVLQLSSMLGERMSVYTEHLSSADEYKQSIKHLKSLL